MNKNKTFFCQWQPYFSEATELTLFVLDHFKETTFAFDNIPEHQNGMGFSKHAWLTVNTTAAAADETMNLRIISM